ncbi:glyoxalase bleomycin resistance protein dioxygenase [Leptolyngbya sp. Heron Island J]|uniref:VOC family protein n=1 Tax=Leptolyngbya sp. Heron Island J TaxID=1385935 RepID=UPI0003B962C6|nr:VOC family protein [Leptolyngbya sp. Heron Island J]ESA33980.1 glyoxalase bleomycin resistance protein dioxygenase [Leptolyngbya sp. Heron Island J]
MCKKSEVGRVVWHDLITHDVARAKRFYADLLGWEYQIEHASDFVWKPGEADYPLIFANGQAHGGLVDVGEDISSYWIAYVMVEDVDTVTTKAKTLGALIEREPFDTPGVGRGAVHRDPQGAIISPFCPSYGFPAPDGIFLWDELITDDVESAQRFYSELFAWHVTDIDVGQMSRSSVFKCVNHTDVVGVTTHLFDEIGFSAWISYLATNDVDATLVKAKMLGASVIMEGTDMPKLGRCAILVDPTGAIFGLLAPGRSYKN